MKRYPILIVVLFFVLLSFATGINAAQRGCALDLATTGKGPYLSIKTDPIIAPPGTIFNAIVSMGDGCSHWYDLFGWLSTGNGNLYDYRNKRMEWISNYFQPQFLRPVAQLPISNFGPEIHPLGVLPTGASTISFTVDALPNEYLDVGKYTSASASVVIVDDSQITTVRLVTDNGLSGVFAITAKWTGIPSDSANFFVTREPNAEEIRKYGSTQWIREYVTGPGQSFYIYWKKNAPLRFTLGGIKDSREYFIDARSSYFQYGDGSQANTYLKITVGQPEVCHRRNTSDQFITGIYKLGSDWYRVYFDAAKMPILGYTNIGIYGQTAPYGYAGSQWINRSVASSHPCYSFDVQWSNTYPLNTVMEFSIYANQTDGTTVWADPALSNMRYADHFGIPSNLFYNAPTHP